MRFLSIYKTVERNSPPTQEEMATMGKLVEEGMKAGWLLSTEGCLPTKFGARVRQSGGKATVTDGPFTSKRDGRRICDIQGEFEGRGDGVGQKFPQRC